MHSDVYIRLRDVIIAALVKNLANMRVRLLLQYIFLFNYYFLTGPRDQPVNINWWNILI